MRNFILVNIFCLIIFVSFTVHGNAGTVLYAIGKTFVEKPQQSVLKKGDIIIIGDTIVTGDKSRVQLKMSDGARLSIRPNSRLNIENYLFTKNSSGAVTSAKSSLNLIKGGFRTITGAISAGQDKSGYQVKTAVATIGIRGTDYSVLLCQSDCTPLEASTKSKIDDGLYAGVSQGAIVLINNIGELQLDKAESGFVANIDTLPVKLLGPPSSLFGQTVPVKQTIGKKEPENSVLISEITVSEPIAVIEKPSKTNLTTTLLTQEEVVISQVIIDDNGNEIPIDNGIIEVTNQPISFALTSLTRSQLTLNGDLIVDSEGNLSGFTFDEQLITIGTAKNLNSGFDVLTGFRWGRWSQGIAQFNTGESLNLTEQSLHWLSNDLFDNDISLPQSGQANYILMGNTDPTDNTGHIGILGSASFTADFTNQSVSSQILLGINNHVWKADGNGSIASGLNQFTGIYNSVLIDGSNSGTGSFSGFFSSMLNNSNIPVGAGLTYYLQNNTNSEHVTGSLVFSETTRSPR